MDFSQLQQSPMHVISSCLILSASLTVWDSHAAAANRRPDSAARPAPNYRSPTANRARVARPAHHAPPSRQKLHYRFRRGDRFAYTVSIEWKSKTPGLSGRLTGCPYFVVNYADEQEAVLMVIGRLRYEKLLGDGTARNVPAKDYWMGTTAIVDVNDGKQSGRMGPKKYDCPVAPNHAIGKLIFPKLLRYVGDESVNSWKVDVSRGVIGPNAPPLERIKGENTSTTRALPLGSTRAQLQLHGIFRPDSGDSPTISQATAVFDHRMGAVISHNAKRTRRKHGTVYSITSSVRRITQPEALEVATKLAMEDGKSMPRGIEPRELMRQRLDLKMPDRYDPDHLPPKGTVIGYYDSEFPVHEAWYAAKYVRPVDRDKVLIRYLGSGEEETIRARGMAILK